MNPFITDVNRYSHVEGDHTSFEVIGCLMKMMGMEEACLQVSSLEISMNQDNWKMTFLMK